MRILAVVVRYNMPVEESKTLLGLTAALLTEPSLAATYSLLLWDNSPEALLDPSLPIPLVYRHSPHNLGVSGAYNGAMEYAEEHGFVWMLLLDQDSALTAEFLHAMRRHAKQLVDHNEVAAITPSIQVEGAIHFPRQRRFGRDRVYPKGECGIASGEVVSINSGCLMRVSFLRSIGGFSRDFWLDYSDLYVFHQLHRANFKVWRAADAVVQHEMTIMDYDRLMSPWRYKNFSYAETAFYDLYRNRLERAVHHLRLFVRAIRQRRRFKNRVFSEIAWEQFVYRLRYRRAERLARWRQMEATRLHAGTSRPGKAS